MSGTTPTYDSTVATSRNGIPTQRSNAAPRQADEQASAAGPRRRRRFDLALGLLIVGAALRIWQWALGHSFWLDEQLIALNLRQYGLAELIGEQDNGQGAPLGWAWMERLILQTFGEGERVMRLPSLVFGIAILVVAWRIGRPLLGQIGTAVLVALFALSPTMVIYSDELKHYSADVFWVLALLGLAARVLQDPRSGRKIWQFWLVATFGLWFGMGAFLVAPGLALVLGGQAWLRHGWRTAFAHILPGMTFTASFVAHYLLSLRYSASSEYLANYWSGIGYPPDGARIRGTAYWFAEALARLSDSPLDLWDLASSGVAFRVSAAVAATFWCLVAAGIIIAFVRRVEFGLLLAAPLLSGLVFSLLHLVPLAVRLALWLVPAMYLAVAVATAAAARALPQVWRHRNDSAWPRIRAGLGSAAAALALAFPLALVPMTMQSVRYLSGEPDLNDRAAIQWMREQHRPGDLVLMVSSATRAAQWYDPQRQLSPMRAVYSVPSGPNCDPGALGAALKGYSRVIAYAGVQFMPYLESPRVLRQRLSELGQITETRSFGTLGVVHVVEVSNQPAATQAPGDCIMVF